MDMGKVMLEGFECERCGHKWVKRSATEGDPVICPKCKSPYWNRPRQADRVIERGVKKEVVKGDRPVK
jgi:hypothetical protein